MKPDDSAQDAIPKQTKPRLLSEQGAKSSPCVALRFPEETSAFGSRPAFFVVDDLDIRKLEGDFWLEIPERQQDCGHAVRRGSEITAGSRYRGEAYRARGTARRQICILGSTEKTFTGTGNVEWTLQMMEFISMTRQMVHLENLGRILKGIHLLLLGIVNSILAAVFLFGVLVTFSLLHNPTQARLGLISRAFKRSYLSAHLAVMWGLYSGLAYLNYTYADKLAGLVAKWDPGIIQPCRSPGSRHRFDVLVGADGVLGRAVYPIEMIAIGDFSAV